MVVQLPKPLGHKAGPSVEAGSGDRWSAWLASVAPRVRTPGGEVLPNGARGAVAALERAQAVKAAQHLLTVA